MDLGGQQPLASFPSCRPTRYLVCSFVKNNGKPKGRGSTLVVDLGPKLYRKLQDEGIRRSRREGRRVPMTEIARSSIERELAPAAKTER